MKKETLTRDRSTKLVEPPKDGAPLIVQFSTAARGGAAYISDLLDKYGTIYISMGTELPLKITRATLG